MGDKRIEANLAVKRSLSEALLAIIEEKGLASIGVSEPVIRAGVSRSSFYRNFDSIDDVLAYGYNEIVRTYADVCPYPYVDFTNVACMAWNL
jgi:AcrR family transcriptional regulator